MNKCNKNIAILGSGIGGLSAASELLDLGYNVVVLEKDNKIGGVLQGINAHGCSVDIGFRRFYCRIPEVKDFFFKTLSPDFVEYDLRIGVVYKDKVYEREHRFKGHKRGIPLFHLLLIILDRAFQSLKYAFFSPRNFEEAVYAKKGKKLTRIFSQAYYEKLKGITWDKLPIDYKGERVEQKTKNTIINLFNRSGEKIDDADKWYHPRRGSSDLIKNLERKILDKGGKIILNCKVTSVENSENIWKINIKNNQEYSQIIANQLISSLSIEVITKLIKSEKYSDRLHYKYLNKRDVLVVILFLDKPFPLPHSCIRITDPETKITRLTNYASFSTQMVPSGKGCIGLEFIYGPDDVISRYDDEKIIKITLDYVVEKKLIIKDSCFDKMVFRISNTDVASCWEDYRDDQTLLECFKEISSLPNFYHVSRTGIDKTIYAAIMAALAIDTGNKMPYLRKTRPDLDAPWLN